MDEADEIVEEYVRSGLTQRVFARKVGISVSTLQYWLRRQARAEMKKSERHEAGIARTLSKVSLLEVELDGDRTATHTAREGYEVEWACGTRVRLPSGFRDEEVRRLFTILKEAR